MQHALLKISAGLDSAQEVQEARGQPDPPGRIIRGRVDATGLQFISTGSYRDIGEWLGLGVHFRPASADLEVGASRIRTLPDIGPRVEGASRLARKVLNRRTICPVLGRNRGIGIS